MNSLALTELPKPGESQLKKRQQLHFTHMQEDFFADSLRSLIPKETTPFKELYFGFSVLKFFPIFSSSMTFVNTTEDRMQ